MTRDHHRSPGRLAPSRPDTSWGPHGYQVSNRRRATGQHSGQYDGNRKRPPYDEIYDDREDPADPYGHEEYIEPELYAAHPTASAPGPVIHHEVHEHRASDPAAASRGPVDYPLAAQAGESAATPSDFGYYNPNPVPTPHVNYTQEPEVLTMQERHSLLMRTIELFDEWKMASIRANEEKARLEAYLVPRDKPLELKDAIRRNQFMVITIDRLGNTNVKQPKRHGPLRRFTRWLLGD